ncbi:hypothetical protein LRR18_17735, partial [Mangrovimonas sp. AS39]|uniref:hypothetical protein n=1 Tax=Mangrovimonas futianensis TaxID=2895523 RepID=UPI001E515249
AGARIFYYDGYAGEFSFDGAYWDFAPVSGGVGVIDMAYTRDWLAVGTRDEIWIFLADKGARSRFVRNWWDGSDPDVIVGAGCNVYLDNTGRVPGFEN